MNPMTLNFTQPQGMQFGSMGANNTLTFNGIADPRFGKSLQELNAGIVQRARRARAMGMSEQEVQANIAQDLAEQQDVRTHLATAPSEHTMAAAHKKGNFLTNLLPTLGGSGGALGGAAAGAAVGSVVPILGTAVGGILGGIIGGAGGSALGKIGENKLEGNNWKDEVGAEALWGGIGGAIPGTGKAGVSLFERLAGRGAESAVEKAAGRAVAEEGAQAATGRIANMGNELRMNARGLNNAGKLFPTQAERQTVNAALDQAGLKGSARNQFRNVGDAIGALNERATAVLSKHPASTDALDFAQQFSKTAAGSVDAEKPAFKNAITRLQNMVLERADQQTGQLSAQHLYDLKTELGGELASAWKKLENGTSLSPEENAFMKVWQSLDGKITEMVPEAKKLTKAQSLLIQSQPVLDKAASQNTKLFNVLPLSAPTQALQSGQDKAGRILQMVGGVGRGAGGAPGAGRMAAGAITRQAVPRLFLGGYGGDGADAAGTDPNNPAALNMFGNEQDATDFANQLQEAGIDVGGIGSSLLSGQAGAGSVGEDGSTPGGGKWDEVNGLGVLPRDAIAKALAADLQTTGGKNFNQILTYADYVNQTGDYAPKTGGGKLDATSQKALVGLQSASNTIDQIEQLYQQGGGGRGKAGGLVANLFGKVSGSGADTYNQQVGGMAAQISRALGNTGAMSDQDVARAVGLLPKITDTPAQAQTKLNALRQLISANANSVMQSAALGGGGGSADLALAGAGNE